MALQQYLNQVIIHYPRSNYNQYAEQVDSGSGTEYNARVEINTKRERLPNGEVQLIDGYVFLTGDPGILIDERIDYASIKYRVWEVKKNIDGQGNIHHVTLKLVKWTI